jgi:hypothetical protein
MSAWFLDKTEKKEEKVLQLMQILIFSLSITWITTVHSTLDVGHFIGRTEFTCSSTLKKGCKCEYSGDPKTGHPNSGKIRKPNFFKFGFGMAIGILKPDKFVRFSNVFGRSASLDRFGMNKIFFITLFFIKRSRLEQQKTSKNRTN